MKKTLIFSLCALAQVACGESAQAGDAFGFFDRPSPQAYCREYTQDFVVGNHVERGYGTACMQPDGSWAIQTPASPSVAPTYVVQQEPVYVVERPRTVVVRSAPYVVYHNHPYRWHRHYW